MSIIKFARNTLMVGNAGLNMATAAVLIAGRPTGHRSIEERSTTDNGTIIAKVGYDVIVASLIIGSIITIKNI